MILTYSVGVQKKVTINDPKKFVAGLWDWGCLDSCFPGRMKVTDIDGFLERNSKFLVLETKGKGVPVPKGQEIMFKNMQKTGLFTVVIVWGEPGSPSEMQVIYPTHSQKRKRLPLMIYTK